jgi:hypothetical protein
MNITELSILIDDTNWALVNRNEEQIIKNCTELKRQFTIINKFVSGGEICLISKTHLDKLIENNQRLVEENNKLSLSPIEIREARETEKNDEMKETLINIFLSLEDLIKLHDIDITPYREEFNLRK